MTVHDTALSDVKLIEPNLYRDDRGFFMVTFEQQRYAEAGIVGPFVQDNHSGSKRGVLRGLHYQVRHAQGKLVQVLQGAVFDVAVDLRRSSPTFGRWAGETLSAENRHQLWIPPGFAHGFLVLSDWAELAYKVTDIYAPTWDRSLRWDDPDVGIVWPHDPGASPMLSDKDAAGLLLHEAEVYA